MEGLRSRTWLAWIGIVLSIVFVVPNFYDVSNLKWWPSAKLNYGLDIQGGLHLVMGADVDSVVATTINRQIVSLKSEFQKEGFAAKDFIQTKAREGQFEILVNNLDEAKKVEASIQKNHSTTLQILSVQAEKVEVKYFDSYLADQKQNTIRQAIETIRNRIDEFGVSEVDRVDFTLGVRVQQHLDRSDQFFQVRRIAESGQL